MKRGYSLLEVVIYVSSLALIALLVIGSILSVYRAFLKTKVERRIVADGDIAIETMVRSARSSTGVDAVASIFGVSPGVLKLNSIKFSLSGTVLQVQYGAGAVQDLTSPDSRVTKLVFYRDFSSSSSVSSDIIKIEMTLQSGTGQFLKSKNFYGSAVLRGEY